MRPFLLFSFLLSTLLSPLSSSLDPYETLNSHGLPRGLFPRGITNFTLSDDGQFEAGLAAACTATLDNAVPVRYNSSIAGSLSYGQMAKVSGVSAQDLFLWFPVLAIRVDVPSSGVIYFNVGVVNKQLALSLFDGPPDCVPDSDPPAASIVSLALE